LQFKFEGKFVAETLILIPGRSAQQGTSLNQGKLKDEYKRVTSTLEMHPDDMTRLNLADGDEVSLSNDIGKTVVRCLGKKPEDLPLGTAFIPYGPPSSELMASDTAGCGMPLSKHMIVEIEKIPS
jgi:formylmethanofuran dehydrogenase subunit D